MVASNRLGHGCAWRLVLCLVFFASTAGAYVGFNYGTNGNNLPAPAQAVQLIKKLGITQVRIYDTDPAVLSAFQGSSVQLVVGILNSELEAIGQSNASAASFVSTKIGPYVNSTYIYAVAVGNEVLTQGNDNMSSLLISAMSNVHTALVANNLDSIKVSTPCSMDMLLNTFPPSTGSFAGNQTYVPGLLDFLSETSSFFMLNVYPWKAYAANSASINLDYALFNATTGVQDTNTGFVYSNLFDSQIDAVYAAIAKYNHSDLTIVVSESGWPTAGDTTELGASVINAQTYNANLVKHIVNKTGTPAKPGVAINTYLYELYSEDLNVGPTSQRNFGMFNNDSTPVYAVDLSGSNGTGVAGSKSWCTARLGTSETILQAAIDFSCGKVNCSAIQPNATCYLPDTRYSHASYAMNMYYVSSNEGTAACNFQGAAQITATDPSYDSCTYPARLSTATSDGHVSVPGPSLAQLIFSTMIVSLAMNLKH